MIRREEVTAETKPRHSGLKQDYSEPRTYLGLQSLVIEMGHGVLFATHHGHLNHRVLVEERFHCLFLIKCFLPLG